MDDLVRFLRARLDEDERTARRAASLCGCHSPAPFWSFRDGDKPTDGRILVVNDPHPDIKRRIGRRWSSSYEGLFMAEDIARHDPARVLREVEAKRRILDDCEGVIVGWVHEETRELARDVLRNLALSHADHPEYQEVWRP